MTELRLAGASTIDQANAVLRNFLPHYNLQFAVPAELAEPAYRPWNGNRPLDEILCFKHTRKVARDNTVQYQWRTLQLLPSAERPSYAGVQVEVLDTPTAACRCVTTARSYPASPRHHDAAHCGLPMGHWLPRRKSAAS